MYKATYDTDDDGIVNNALTVAWATNTKEPTGFVNRTTSSMSFNNSTREFIIAPSGVSTFPVYIKGELFNKTSESIIITPVSGCHFIYWDLNNTLSSSPTPWHIDETVQIATVYWNGSEGLLAEERHGCIMDMMTHEYLHETVGSPYSSGLAGSFTDTTFSIGTGEWYDEDLEFLVESPYTTCRVLWLIGSVWNWTAGQTKYYHEVSNILQYNNAGALANVQDNRYVAYWIYITSNIAYPIISIMGQREDINLADARANNKPENLSLGTLPFGEMKLLFRVIIRRSGTSEVYQETTDYRNVSPLPTSNYVATDHGTLTGLQDEDHGASAIFTDTSSFNNNLSAADTTVQAALNTIDNLVIPSGTGATTLAALTDVNISGVVTGQHLSYNSGTSKWIPATPSTIGDWITIADTATYDSADDPTYIMSIDADMTSILSVGMRIKLTQTTVKYFIITVVGAYSGGATLITLYGGTDYDLANASISDLYYSSSKIPFGFPADPSKWTVLVTDATDRSQGSCATGTWYNIGSEQISIPIGIWYTAYKVRTYGYQASETSPWINVALSTANNSMSDNNWETGGYTGHGNANFDLGQSLFCAGIINVASKTTLYLIARWSSAANATMYFLNGPDGGGHPLSISATCAYL